MEPDGSLPSSQKAIYWSTPIHFITFTLKPRFLRASCPKHAVLSVRATLPAYFVLLDLISPVIFWREFGFSLRSFLQAPVTSFLLGPSIPLSVVFEYPRSVLPIV